MGDVRLTPRQIATLFEALDRMAAGAQLVRQVLIEAMEARRRRRAELRVFQNIGDAQRRRKARPRA